MDSRGIMEVFDRAVETMELIINQKYPHIKEAWVKCVETGFIGTRIIKEKHKLCWCRNVGEHGWTVDTLIVSKKFGFKFTDFEKLLSECRRIDELIVNNCRDEFTKLDSWLTKLRNKIWFRLVSGRFVVTNRRYPKPKTQNPKPKTQNPKPKT